MTFRPRSKPSAISRRWLLLVACLVVAVFASIATSTKTQAAEQQNTVNLYLFWGDGCPHCARAKQALEPYINRQSNINYKKYEVYYSAENQQKMQEVGEELDITAGGVPLIIVGDKPFVGYSDGIGDDIKDRIAYCSVNACNDSVAAVVGVQKPVARDLSTSSDSADGVRRADNIIDLPLLGEVSAAHFSLPVITIIIALLDGFNPCAMWALLFIITLLIGMRDRKKMWLYGTAFIATSAVVYFMFMAAWLNLFMVIGHVTWLRALIGVLAVTIGAYYLYDWYQHKTGCKVTGSQKRRAVFEKLRAVVKQKNVWLGLGGVIALAAAVNLVELACSAGLPVLFTGILTSAGLETWQYYTYMLLYILFFMLDDMIVFAIAMMTFRVIGIDSKYSRMARLVGGLLMVLLGALLVFAPQVLMFG